MSTAQGPDHNGGTVTDQWWNEQAVEALHDAGAYCGTCDYEDWGEDYRCPDCVRCLQGYLTALTPHVEAYRKRFFVSDYVVSEQERRLELAFEERCQRHDAALRAEAFEEAKRIVTAYSAGNWWSAASPKAVLAALDRASTATPEAT